LALLAEVAVGQQWQIEPSADLALGYDDNVRLQVEAPEGSFSAVPRAGVRATRATESTATAFAADLGYNYFTDISDQNSAEGSIGVETQLERERNRFRLNALFEAEPTRTSEEATSGLTQTNRQRYRLLLEPSWTHDLTERSSLDLALDYRNVFYEDAGDTPLFDYQVGALRLGGLYRLTERMDVRGTLDYGRYEADDIERSYDNYGARLGVDYLLTETVSVVATVGVRRTESTFSGPSGQSTISEESSGPTYDVSLRRRFEAGGGLNLKISRDLRPSGSGRVLDTTNLAFGLDYPLSERWRWGFDAAAYRNRRLGDEPTRGDRKFARGAVRFGYELDPDWALSFGYRYRWQKRDELPDSAQSNAVFFALDWNRPWDVD
jgi:outer membrane protein assembly factor BamA